MKISVKLALDERGGRAMLRWLARGNAIILWARPELPGLDASGVRYRREQDETWCDYLNLLAQGHQDCDGLAAARAGELIARGATARRRKDPGHTEARHQKLTSIPAAVLLLTTTDGRRPGQYHGFVRYRVGSRGYREDPSARLRTPPAEPSRSP